MTPIKITTCRNFHNPTKSEWLRFTGVFIPLKWGHSNEEWCQKCGYSSGDAFKILKNWGYVPYQAIKEKLTEVNECKSNDSGRYNYFFLNTEKHLGLINKPNVF